jgi:hypothetical protein
MIAALTDDDRDAARFHGKGDDANYLARVAAHKAKLAAGDPAIVSLSCVGGAPARHALRGGAATVAGLTDEDLEAARMFGRDGDNEYLAQVRAFKRGGQR